jgi:hypothetical protein
LFITAPSAPTTFDLAMLQRHANQPIERWYSWQPRQSQRWHTWSAGVGDNLIASGYERLSEVPLEQLHEIVHRPNATMMEMEVIDAQINAIIAEYGHLGVADLELLVLRDDIDYELRREFVRWAWNLETDSLETINDVPEHRREDLLL